MLLFIYYGSVISRLLLKFVYSREIKKRAAKEGYVFKKKGEFPTKKLTRFIKGCLLTFVPVVNTLSVIHYLAKGLDKSYEEAITFGLANGAFAKSSGPVKEKESLFDQVATKVDKMTSGVKQSAEKYVNRAENYIENKVNERNVQSKPVVSQPVQNKVVQNKPVVSAPVQRNVVQSKPVTSAPVQSSTYVRSAQPKSTTKSYDNMSIQEKLAYLEAERSRAKNLQRNTDGFSRKL